MASWGIADLVKEISDMEVIAMRNKGSELLPRMKTSLMAKMQGVQLISASNYVALMDALEKSSLPDAMKKELETCFEEKTVASLEGPTRLQNRPQSMTMPYNYLSKSEWQKVLDGANTVDACNVVIKRMKLCGLKSLKEDSKKHLTAFLVCLQMRTTKFFHQLLRCTNCPNLSMIRFQLVWCNLCALVWQSILPAPLTLDRLVVGKGYVC